MPQRLHYPASTQLGGSDQLVLDEGVLSLGTPRARVGDKTEASAASAITSGGRMLRTEMPTPGAAGASTSSIAGGAAYVYAIRSYHEHCSHTYYGSEAARARYPTALTASEIDPQRPVRVRPRRIWTRV